MVPLLFYTTNPYRPGLNKFFPTTTHLGSRILLQERGGGERRSVRKKYTNKKTSNGSTKMKYKYDWMRENPLVSDRKGTKTLNNKQQV